MSEPKLELLGALKQALRDKYDEKQRRGIHVSDLTLCLRKAVRHRLNPAPLTDNDLRNFNQGRSHHESVQDLAKSLEKQGHNVQVEKVVRYNGIIGHIDLLIDNKIPVEIKTTRQPEAKPSKHYIIQLKTYMAMLDSDVGYLLVESYNAEDNPWSETVITMSEEERITYLRIMEDRAKEFKNALDNKNWLLASGVKENDSLNWLCKRCPYKEECWSYEEQSKFQAFEARALTKETL